MKQILIAVGALSVVAFLEGLYHTYGFFAERRREELRRRLQSLGGGENASLRLLREGKLSSIRALDDLLRGMPVLERLEALLEQAHVHLTVAQLITLTAVLSVSGAGAGFALRGVGLSVLLGLVGALGPLLVVLAIREKRAQRLSEQLPDALDMMARSLRAGHALPSAFKLVASEMPNPVSVEFARAFEEQNLGMSFDRAVVQMTARVPSCADLKVFAVSVIVQKETGGNLVEVLEKIAETVRARYRFYGRLRSLTAEGKVSAIVLGSLPVLAPLAISVLNPSYFEGFVENPLGRSIVIYAVVSWAVGLLWLRQMAKVEF